MDYLYDGTYTGFMTSLYLYFKYRECTGIYSKKFYQKSLTSNYKIVKTNEDLSQKMEGLIRDKISSRALKLIYYSFLSNEEKKEMFIIKFVKLGLIRGNITGLYSHEDTFPLQKIYDKVSKEKHRFLGIIRFKDINGVLFSKYSPDHDITELIMPHFSDRYKNENLIIFDEKRLKAGIYNKSEWYLSKIDKRIYDKFKDEEEIYEKMWREYFNSISIDDRKNLKAQFQFVPYRYRKNITEFNR